MEWKKFKDEVPPRGAHILVSNGENWRECTIAHNLADPLYQLFNDPPELLGYVYWTYVSLPA